MHYLGPTAGKIPLSTWDEVVSAAEGGLLEETQRVELKKQLRPSGKEGNLELARDLASLAFEGGVLIIGVEDKTYEVVGCPIDGYHDRISQVASMGVHPSLSPIIYPALPHPEDPTKSVLVVEVPPSEHAPHMVDDSYWGRSSNGKRKLGDTEVRRRMEAQTGSDAAFKARLLSMVDSDPLHSMVQDHPTGNGHVYLLAEPCAPVPGRPRDVDLRESLSPLFRHDHYGTLERLRYNAADTRGTAVASRPSDNDLVERKYEDDLCHLLCRDDDSSLEFVSGGGTIFRRQGRPDGETSGEVVGTNTIVHSTWQFFRLVEDLSTNRWGYTGQWRIGIRVTNLSGAHMSFNDLFSSERVFQSREFTSQAVITPAAWTDGAEPEARKLLHGFLRAIGRTDMPLDQVRL